MPRGASINYANARSVRRQPQFSAIDKSRNLFIVGISFLLVLLIVGAIFYIGTHIKVVNLGYKINQEIQRKEQLIEDSKHLELEIAQLKSPTRIEMEAKDKLTMTMALPGQVIYLSKLDNPQAMQALAATFGSPNAVVATKAPPLIADKLPEKPKAELSTKKVSKKENPQVLVAKIIEEPKRTLTGTNKSTPAKFKQSVPAIMLDPLP